MNKHDVDPPRWNAATDAATPAARWLHEGFRDAAAVPPQDLLRLERAWRRAGSTTTRRRPRFPVWALVAGAFLLGSAATSVAALGVVRGLWTSVQQTVLRRDPVTSATRGPATRPVRWRIKARAAGDIEVTLSPRSDDLQIIAGPADTVVRDEPPRPSPSDPGPAPAAAPAAPPLAAKPARAPASAPSGGSAPGRGGEAHAAAPVGPPVAAHEPPAITFRPAPPIARTLALAAAPAAPAVTARPARLPLRRPTWESEPADRASRSGTLAAPAPRDTGRPLEGQALAAALRHLRIDDNPRAALRDLDLYRSYYPSGRLGDEAKVIRAEALFRSGDRVQALAVLDLVPLGESGRRRLALVRGELRAQRERCAEALDDFRRVVDLGRPDDATERALYGQAACRARLGDAGRARVDVETYLHLFPASPHKAAAERFLVESGSSAARP